MPFWRITCAIGTRFRILWLGGIEKPTNSGSGWKPAA
jgi:hypothetical protein